MASGTRRKTPLWRVLLALLGAVALHGLAVLLVVLLPPGQGPGEFSNLLLGDLGPAPPVEAEDTEPLQIESLIEQIDRPERPTAAEQRRKKEEEKTRPDGQVVDIARPLIEQHPDEARFLSEYDSQVKKETKGPAGRGQGGAKEPRPPQLSAPPVPPGVAAQDIAPTAMRAPKPRVLPGSESEAPLPAPDGTMARRGVLPSPAEAARTLFGGGLPGGPASVQSLPQPDRPQGSGTPGTMDYLKDIEDGETTALTAKKWKFAGFFNRLKRAVQAEWHPDTVYLRHDPSGNIYGLKDRTTVLRVSLNAEGEIATMAVLSPSGVDFLDDEAQGAFRRAQPFLNPPTQLVEGDGQIHFNFAFIFELSGKASFKVFRY